MVEPIPFLWYVEWPTFSNIINEPEFISLSWKHVFSKHTQFRSIQNIPIFAYTNTSSRCVLYYIAEMITNSHSYYRLLFMNIEFTSFSTTIPQGKHVMLSYHPNNQKMISEIYQILQKAHIPVWFEERRDLEHNIYNRYGLQNDLSFSNLCN